MAKKVIEWIKGIIQGVFKEGLKSQDRPTRRMSRMVVVSLVGILIVIVLGVGHYLDLRRIKNAELAKVELVRLQKLKEAEELEARKKAVTLSLGQFFIELKEKPGLRKAPGMLNTATLEVVIRCDRQETCDLIKKHEIAARNELTRMFTPQEREDLLSIEGKRALRKALTEKLNEWLGGLTTDGRVEELYFSQFIIS